MVELFGFFFGEMVCALEEIEKHTLAIRPHTHARTHTDTDTDTDTQTHTDRHTQTDTRRQTTDTRRQVNRDSNVLQGLYV